MRVLENGVTRNIIEREREDAKNIRVYTVFLF
jgi:hypothetical protein